MNFVLVMLGGAIGSAARYGVGKLTLGWLGPHYPWGTLTVNLIGGLLMLPHFVWPDRHAWLLLLGYGLMQGLAGVLLMLATLLAPANRIAPTQYSQMLWAIGFGYWLFGDRLDWPMLVGIALILGAGLFTLVREGQVTPWWRRQKLV